MHCTVFVHPPSHPHYPSVMPAYPGSPPLELDVPCHEGTATLGMGLSSLEPVTTTHMPVSEVLPLQMPAISIDRNQAMVPMPLLSAGILPRASPAAVSNMKGEGT